MKMIFLVDGDNNIGTGLKGIDMLSEQDTVLIFYQKGLALTKIKKLCAASRADVQYVESVKGGKNSIDFQIITELGVLVGKREADFAYVISQDKGYAASIEALRLRYADAFQEVALRPAIEECLHLTFVLKAANRRDLHDALLGEYGAAQGQLLYDRLREIFQAPEGAEKQTMNAPAKEPEKQPAKRPLLPRRKAPAKPQTNASAKPPVAPVANQPAKPPVAPAANQQAKPPVAPAANQPAKPPVAPVANQPVKPVVAPAANQPAKPPVAPAANQQAKPPVTPAANQQAKPPVTPVVTPPSRPAVAQPMKPQETVIVPVNPHVKAPLNFLNPAAAGSTSSKNTRTHRGGRRRKPTEKPTTE